MASLDSWQFIPCCCLVTLVSLAQGTVFAFQANTPWKRVKSTLGLGTKVANLVMKSNGWDMTCIVPSR